jgi:hypothetical protein
MRYTLVLARSQFWWRLIISDIQGPWYMHSIVSQLQSKDGCNCPTIAFLEGAISLEGAESFHLAAKNHGVGSYAEARQTKETRGKET